MIKRIKAKAPDRWQITPSEVWFEVPAENIGRASRFYTSLFGSKICGMLGRPIVNCIGDSSLDELAARVEDLGGEICLSKKAALQMGYFVICRDTEGQMFRLWEATPTAE